MTEQMDLSYSIAVPDSVSTTLPRISVGVIFKILNTGKSSSQISSACQRSMFGTVGSRRKSRESEVSKIKAASSVIS